jgi:protein-disulfide isomerase
MSGKQDREKRRQERIAAESKVSSGDQRTRILQIGAGAVFLAIVAVVIVIVIAGSSSDGGGDAQNIEEVAAVDSLVNGLPQQKLVLGDASAPVELIEYGDLQCPICKQYSEEILPPIVEKQVKNGEVKVIFRNFIIISEESTPAGAAAIAAGTQGKGWDFIELFYRNQGKERSGYVTEEFLEAVAKAAGVKDMAKFNKERKSKKVLEEVARTSGQAETLGFGGTPSFAVKGPGSNGLELVEEGVTQEGLEERIAKAS